MKFTLAISMLLLVSVAHAQSWNAGIKTDLNYSGISGKGMSSSLTSGAQAGIFGEYNWMNKWGVRPEILYTQSNYKKADDYLVYYNVNGNEFAKDNLKLSYLSIPVLVTYKLNDMFSVMAGPQYSFMIYADEDLLRDNSYAFKKTSLSANIGLQFNISAVGLYVRYNHDITNINNIDDRYQWRSQHIQAGVAIKLYQSGKANGMR